MVKSIVSVGAEIDGFTVGECVHSGGMATLWSVTHPDIAGPLLMKIPLVSEGEDPAAIVSFEMEQMILPRLSGPHVPACHATGDFARQAYVVMEPIPGTTLYSRLGELPLAYEEARVVTGKIAVALADLHRQNVVHHDIKPSRSISDCRTTINCPTCCRRNSAYPTAPRPTWRPSAFWGCATIRAATCFRWACSCTSSPRASGRSVRPKPCAACGAGCGAIRIRRAS